MMSRIFKSRNNSEASQMCSNRPNNTISQFGKSTSSTHRQISLTVPVDRTPQEIAAILERRYGIDLTDCQYYIHDRIRLHGHWPLSTHCTQPSGMVQLLLEIKSMPTHISSYRYTRLNIVDILDPDVNGEFSSAPIGDGKGRFNEISCDQRPNKMTGFNGMSPSTASLHPTSDGSLNPDGPIAEQESIFISSSAVLEAFTNASRAMENMDRVSVSSSYVGHSNTNLPSNIYPTRVSTSQYSLSYPITERLAGVGGDVGGKWIPDEHYRCLMRMNNIPTDPSQWSEMQVVMWINWASKQFGLIDNNPSNSRQNGDGGKLAKAFEGLPGQDLLGLSLSDLSSRFQLSGSIASPNVSFFTHFELLKSCREVCVPYKPQVQPYPVASNSLRTNRQMGRSRVRSSRNGNIEYTPNGPYSSTYPIPNGSAVIGRFPGSSAGGVTVGLNGAVFSSSLPLTSNLRLNGGGAFQSRINQPSTTASGVDFPSSSSSYFTSSPPSLQPGFTSLGSGSSVVGTDPPVAGFRAGERISSSFLPYASSTSVDRSGALGGGVRKYRVVPALSPSHLHHESGTLTMAPIAIGIGGNQSTVAGSGCQIHLWQFLLELLTDWRHQDAIHWVNGDGEFRLANPERVAEMWGLRKNKPAMNYEKLSRALRYYYDGDMIAKVPSKRFCYKFICDLKTLMGYSAGELHKLVCLCAHKHGVTYRNGDSAISRKRPLVDCEAWFGGLSPRRMRNTSSSMPSILETLESDSTSADVDVSPHFSRPEEERRIMEEEDEDGESFEFCDVDDIDKVAAVLKMEADECSKIAEQKSRRR